ncbi:MAG: hypothetical protein ACE5G0_18980 [Rhodothermales bacterium]
MVHPPLLHCSGTAALLFLLVAVLPACAQEASLQTPNLSPTAASLTVMPPYTFDEPDTLFQLPNRLREISGITVLDDRYVGAVQDEKGRLYLINYHTGEVEEERRFGKDGDFEDLARVGNRIFVLRSDGRLIEILDRHAEKPTTTTHRTKLRARHDTEGLAYDASHNRLLIACKEYPGKGLGNKKAIYAFDLGRNVLLDDPVFTIDTEAFSEHVGSDGRLNETIRTAVKPIMDLSGFKPSALALHPLTGEVYVLSSVRKAVVVLSPDGDLTNVWPLTNKRLRQPEAMAFLPNGDLLIASEGAGKKAVLMRFSYHP